MNDKEGLQTQKTMYILKNTQLSRKAPTLNPRDHSRPLILPCHPGHLKRGVCSHMPMPYSTSHCYMRARQKLSCFYLVDPPKVHRGDFSIHHSSLGITHDMPNCHPPLLRSLICSTDRLSILYLLLNYAHCKITFSDRPYFNVWVHPHLGIMGLSLVFTE